MSFLPRSFVIFAVCVPLAILIGVSLAGPLDTTTLALLGSVILVLLSPFLLKHYHSALLVSVNAFVTVFFLPGHPYLWMLMAALGFVLMVLVRAINRDSLQFHFLPSVAMPLIVLSIVAYVTANQTGGVGLFAMGSDVFGGKKYVYIWFAVAAFFVITSRSIAPDQLRFLTGGFFLSGVTAAVSNLAYALGPAFYFLFLLFPTEWGAGQAASENLLGGIKRITGLSPTSMALASFLMMRYGLKGLLDFSKPWRGLAFIVVLGLGFYSGFRSVLVVVGLTAICLFFTERVYKTKHMATIAAGLVLAFGLLLPFAERLPLAVQRSIAFLPIRLNPTAMVDARASLTWRLEIWRLVSAEIPQYFWLGKGYSINPTDLYLADESVKRGVYSPYEPAIIAGDYHNGPLSLIIPFGIWGVLAFLWFLIASHRVLWRNYKYSPPDMMKLNQFLLAFFYARTIFFFVFFGAFYLDLITFVGVVGLSISANSGVREPVRELKEERAEEAPEEYAPGGPLVPAFMK